MKKINNKVLIFFISTLLILQNQTLNATNNICAEIEDFDQSSKLKNIIFSQPLRHILQKIKNDEYVSKSALYHIKITATETLRQLGPQIKPTDDMFDSWITLILMIFPKDPYFNRYLKIAQEKGESEQATSAAQGNLAYMYQYGYSVDKNLNKAVDLYKKAADRGHITSQNNLGCQYFKGKGTDQDLAQAIKWIQKAADQGHFLAQYNLGFIYYKGYGIEKDFKKAFELVRIAAAQGDSNAQYRLGRMYYQGQGVEKDLAQAFKWYLKSYNRIDTNPRLRDSVQDIVFFINPNFMFKNMANITDFKEKIKNSLEAFCKLEGMIKEIHQPDIFFKKNELSILTIFETVFLEMINAYQQPGFMVTCLQPKNLYIFNLSSSPDIKYYEIEGRSFLTFDEDNIMVANKMMNVLLKVDLYHKKIVKIFNIQTKIKESYEREVFKIKEIFHFKEIPKNQHSEISKTLAEHDTLIQKIKNDMEFLNQLYDIPQQLKALLLTDDFERNELFLQNNKYIKHIFKDR